MGIMEKDIAVKSPEEMRAEIQGKEPSAERKLERLADPRLGEEYSFEVKWTDPRGKVWKGDFTNQILSFTQISQVGALRARLGGGMPVESVDDFTANHNEKVAHLTISLVKRPKWAADLGELKYEDLLDQIYVEVARHEAIFSGRENPERGGADGSADGEGDATPVVDLEA